MDKLRKLISDIQKAVKNEAMTSKFVLEGTDKLSYLGFQYDYDTFPSLLNTESFVDESGDTPKNLPEALLWKLGKWKSYKKFCAQFSDDNVQPTNTDVVFYAYAQHLKDKSNPIYDQHAIRALWAICGELNNEEKSKCKHLLMNMSDEWKEAGSGGNAVDCYKIFLKHLDEILKGGSSKEEIDRLLMPLGQAIKRNSNNYVEFSHMCGWTIN